VPLRRILLTGAGGFVGRHLLPQLAAAFPDAEITACTGVTLDITVPANVASVITAVRPDVCVHLAAVSAVPAARQDPWRAWQVNLHGTLSLAEAILREAANRSLTARYVLAEWGKGAPKPLPALESAPVEDRIGDAHVLYRIRLSEPERTRAQHAPKTIHLAGNVPQQVAHALAVARYDGEPTYYLLYLDQAGNVQSDSPHDSAEAAFRQAEFEFGLPPEEWAVTARGAKLEASGE